MESSPSRRVAKIAPSILAADFARLGEQVAEAERAGADRIHVDVMDGINPATRPGVLEEILQNVDQVLVMTVDPGFGHQRFLPTTLAKVRRVRQMVERIKPVCDVEANGGTNVLVAGSAVFAEGESVSDAMRRLRAAIDHCEP